MFFIRCAMFINRKSASMTKFYGMLLLATLLLLVAACRASDCGCP